MMYPGSNLHLLKGKLMGNHAVTVNGNWDLVFKFKNGNAEVIDCLQRLSLKRTSCMFLIRAYSFLSLLLFRKKPAACSSFNDSLAASSPSIFGTERVC